MNKDLKKGGGEVIFTFLARSSMEPSAGPSTAAPPEYRKCFKVWQL